MKKIATANQYAIKKLVYYKGDLTTVMQVKGRKTVNGESRITIRPFRAKGRQTTLTVRECDCIPV